MSRPSSNGEFPVEVNLLKVDQVEMLREDAYVPFDIDFSEDGGTAKVITGPNMAGELHLYWSGLTVVIPRRQELLCSCNCKCFSSSAHRD